MRLASHSLHHCFRPSLVLPAAVLLAVGVLSRAQAGQTFYVGPNNGTWNNGNNWDAGTPPAARDDAVIGSFIPSRNGDVNVTFDANYAYSSGSTLNSLTLDTTGTTGSVILNQTASSTVLEAGAEYIGNGTARNIYNQSAGANSSSALVIGGGTGGVGTYNLSGSGSLSTQQSALLGISVGYDRGTGTLNMSGGTLTGSVGVGSDVQSYKRSAGTGSFNQTGGTASLGSLKVGSPINPSAESFTSNGLYSLSGNGSLSTGFVSIGLSGTGTTTGTFNQTAGTHTASFLGVNSRGVYNFMGGTLTVGSSLGNSGGFTVSNSATLTGTFTLTNNQGGTFRTTSANVTLPGVVTNNGLYVSTGASTQTFGANLIIGATGAMQGGAGETFIVNRNLTNNSAQNTAFDLSAAQLTLSGIGVNHRLTWPGADLGPTPLGYADNFAIGTLELTSGGALSLLDGNSTPGGALYVHAFRLDDGVAGIANIATSGVFNIYYDPLNPANAYLNDQIYALNGGGFLAPAPVPEPSTWALLGLGAVLLPLRGRRRASA